MLAERGMTLSHAALHKYEAGLSTPSARTIMFVAEAFGVRPDYFIRDDPMKVEWLAFRRRHRLPKAAADRIKSAAHATIEHQVRLQRLLGASADSRFPEPQAVSDVDGAEALAQAVREYWKLGEAPVASMTRTIEDHGGVVVEVKPPKPGFDGLAGRADECPVVLISSESASDRKRYNLAHELGHLAMSCDGIAEKEEERLAHRFAAAFLVPASVARLELGTKRRHLDLDELLPLKRRHGLSIQAWIRRASDLEIITPPMYKRLCVSVSRRGWRKHEPGAYEIDERPVRLRQMLLRALAEDLVSHDYAEEVMPGITESAATEFPGEMHLASKLLDASPEYRDDVLRRAAESLRGEYEEGGELRDTDLVDLDDDDDPVS